MLMPVNTIKEFAVYDNSKCIEFIKFNAIHHNYKSEKICLILKGGG